MIYSDWRFCQSIQLSPNETAEYLDILYILQDSFCNLQHRTAALEKLGQLDELRQAYAIPVFIDLLILPDSEKWVASQEDQFAVQSFLTGIRQQLKKLLPEETSPKNELHELVDSLTGSNEENILRKLEKVLPGKRRQTLTGRPYLETNLFIQELLCLTLLSRLSRGHTDRVKKLTSDNMKELFQAAAAGQLGTLPHRLALDILLSQDTDTDTILESFPEDWLSFPEYMEIFARAEFCASPSTAFDRVVAEITGLKVFQTKNQKGLQAQKALWFTDSDSGPQKEIQSAVLWQAVLWELAWELDPIRCVELVNTLWLSPAYGRSKIQPKTLINRNWITGALFRTFGPAFFVEKASPDEKRCVLEQTICTPWQRCSDTGDTDERFRAFPGMQKNAGALRAFTGASLLRKIFSCEPDICRDPETNALRNHSLLHVLLNLTCALESPGPKEERDPALTSYTWSLPLRSLGHYAHHCLTLLGTGVICRNLPSCLWEEFRTQLNSTHRSSSQLRAIYSNRGLLVCARWAVYAQSHYTVDRTGGQESPWEDTEQINNLPPISYASKICGVLFSKEGQEELPPAVQNSSDAMHLYCKAGRAHKRGCSLRPWYGRILRGLEASEQITTYDLLRELPPEESFWSTHLDRSCFTEEAWQYVLTMRLQVALESGRGSSSWFFEWHRELSQKGDLQRNPIVFYALMRLLACQPNPGGDMSRFLDLVLDLIVEIVDIYASEDNAYFQYRLGEELTEADLSFGVWNLHKACANHLIALQRLAYKTGYAQTLQCRFTWKLLNKLAQTGENGAGREQRNVRRRLSDHREASFANKRSNDYKVQLIRHRDWDPLWDRFIQESGILVRTARLRVNMDRIGNGFQDKRMERRNIGIVEPLIAPRGTQDRNQEYQVYLGDEVATAQSSTPFKMGDLAVYNGSRRPARLYRPSWAHREKDDILWVWIKQISIGRCVELREMKSDASHSWKPEIVLPEDLPLNAETRADLLKYWAPDTCSFRADGVYPSENYDCEVVYDQTLKYYVPVERDFCRLMMDAFYGNSVGSEPVKLWFISSNFSSDGVRSALFSRVPGFNYRLNEQDWDPDSFKMLDDQLFQAEEINYGVAVMAVLEESGGFPRLRLVDGAPFDLHNREWAELFSDGQAFTAERMDNGQFQTVCSFQDCDIPINVGFAEESVQAHNAVHRRNADVVNVEVTDDGWNIIQQRKKQVLVKDFQGYSVNQNWCTLEHIRELLELEPGKTVRLGSAMQKDDPYKSGYRKAFLKDSGIPVYCAIESLSLAPESLQTEGMIRGRLCVVENIRTRRLDEREAVSVPLRGLPEEASHIWGIVTDLPVLSRTAAELNIKVTAIFQNCVYPLNISTNAFRTLPKQQGNRVELIRQEGGWIANARWEEFYVRALWSTDRPAGEKPEGHSLGVLTVGPAYQKYYVTQDAFRPTLHLWPPVIGRREEYQRNVFSEWKGHISAQPHFRVSSRMVFGYAQNRCVACLEGRDHKKLWGEADFGAFPKPSNAWQHTMQVYQVPRLADEFCYDVRRIFSPRWAPMASMTQQVYSRQEDDFRWYRAWYQERDRHLEGKLSPNGTFAYMDHKMPDLASDGSITGKWTFEHPFLVEEPLWVKRKYTFRVRARMIAYKGEHDEEERWYASCRQADPFEVDEELAAEFGSMPGDLITDTQLCFAGVDTKTNRLRFEWGYGYTLLIERERVVDTDGCLIGPSLFFGDSILAFSIKLQDGIWVISVPNEAVRPEVMAHLWKDSIMLDIVQLMRVSVDRTLQQVDILDVSRAEYDVGEGGSLINQSWSFKKLFYGALDEESKQLLLEESEEDHSVQTIFALLLDQDDPSAKQRPPKFRYLSLNRAADTSLLNDKTVCLAAGNIEANHGKNGLQISNDYHIRLYIPSELPSPERNTGYPHMTVSVTRRNFSMDESKLRVLYATRQKDFFFGRNMLVRLQELRSTRGRTLDWKGCVRGVCIRKPTGLREWVQNSRACLVTLGETRRRGAQNQWDETIQPGDIVLVEVAPGITSLINREDVEGTYRMGATARLKLEEDVLKAYVILPGDETYIPADGRVAELLIMDRAAKQYANGQEGESPTRAHFTVAGLPQVVLTNSQLLSELIQSSWPRLGIVGRDGTKPVAHETDQENQSACIIIDEETNQPVLQDPHAPQAANLPTDWSRLSYIDERSQTIAEIVRDGVWHYHDQTYGIYDSETQRLKVRKLPPCEEDYRAILVFPEPDGTLRVPKERFRNVGYSARELVENGLMKRPNCPLEWRRRYAVAGTDKDSIWIEAFPGRIVELPKQFLFVSGSMIDLEHFPTQILSPGDQLELEQDMSFQGGQRVLKVAGFRYGLRSNLSGAVRGILPVLEPLPDGVVLGSTNWNMTYPLASGHPFAKGDLAVLTTKGNTLTRNEEIRRGDVVMLGLNPHTGKLVIRGWESITAYPTKFDNEWNGALWMREIFNDFQACKELFAALDSDIPVTITNIDPKKHILWFSYNQREALTGEAVLYCTCAGFLDGAASLQRLERSSPVIILRAGKLLLHMDCGELLPKLSPKQCSAIVQRLRKEQFGIWIHRTSETDPWQRGTHTLEDNAADDTVELLYNINTEQVHGILCQSQKTMCLKWLPYFSAALVGNPYGRGSYQNGDAIWAALKRSAEYAAKWAKPDDNQRTAIIRKARVMEGCMISILNVERKRSDEQWLAPQTKLRAVPLVELKHSDTYHYIAEVYPQGELIRLDSERDDFRLGEPQPAEIVGHDSELIQAVRPGMQRRRQILSKEFHEAYGLSHNGEGTFIGGSSYKEALGQTRWNQYKEVREKAIKDAEIPDENALDSEYCHNHDTGSALVYLYSYFLNRRHSVPSYWWRMVYGYLKLWLENDGKKLLMVFGGNDVQIKKPQYPPTVETVTALTAALLLHRVGESAPDSHIRADARRLAIHAIRTLGLAAESSVHQDVLLECWFERDNTNAGGAWARLGKITIGGELSNGTPAPDYHGTLSMNQYYRLITHCNQVLNQDLPSPRLKAVAQSLLYSIGELKDFDGYEQALEAIHPLTWELAKLGRVLVPKDGDEIASRLQPTVVSRLKSIWNKCWSKKHMTYLLLHTPIPLHINTDIFLRYTHCTEKFGWESNAATPTKSIYRD